MSHLHADQVGSLLRPKDLWEARAAFEAGRSTRAELTQIEDAAILDVLERQKRAGMDVFTDGEYRRGHFMGTLWDAVEGFVESDPAGLSWHGRESELHPTMRATIGGRLRQVRRLSAHESAFLKAHAPGVFKITIPSAGMFVQIGYQEGVTDRFYRTREELADDLVPILTDEIGALVEEGVTYIQIDQPVYTHFADPELVAPLKARGVDVDRSLDEAIRVDNACLAAAKQSGVTRALHMCRGNAGSQWLAQGGYDPIAEKLFNGLDVDRFLLEYDSPRAGSFEPLRFMPAGKQVVLGLVTTKQGQLEKKDDLIRRIEEASKYVPIENLALSPQCGFAPDELETLTSWDQQWQKLELIGETAQQVWG